MKLAREKIDLLMAEQCMTSTDLAAAYGVSRARMNIILNSREITTVCAGRLAAALQTSVANIVEVDQKGGDQIE